MKDQETIAQFIQLRARGLSYSKISAQLTVSKPTLIEWSRKFQFEIQNLRTIETEALAEQCELAQRQRCEKLALHLRRVEEELAKRDLTQVSTSQLLAHATRLRAEAARELGDLRFSTSVCSIPNDEYFEDVLDWKP